MSKKTERVKKAYKFFTDAEQSNRTFTLQDIADASEWSLNTVRTYRTKKWHFFLEEVEDGFRCNGICNISENAFIRLQSQRTDLQDELLRPRYTEAVDMLIDKSRESALLAVQVYNNPLIAFRTPGYVVQMIIAYTALFHAIFERNGVEYWYKEPDGTPKTIDGDNLTWDISQCIKHYYEESNRAEAENLKFFVNIRNKIEHRFLPALDLTFSGKCQALLMNFEELLITEFGKYFALGTNLALALQFSAYNSEQHKSLKSLQASEYDAIRKYSDAYDAQLPDEVRQSLKYSFRAFLIPKIGNHAKSSDIAIEFVRYDPDNPEEMEKYEKQVAFIREKQVPVANYDKLRPSDVIKQVTEKTGVKFKMHHHTKAWKLYQVRPRTYTPEGCKTEFCHFDVTFKQFVYTKKWVEFLCEKVRDPKTFEQIKNYRD